MGLKGVEEQGQGEIQSSRISLPSPKGSEKWGSRVGVHGVMCGWNKQGQVVMHSG